MNIKYNLFDGKVKLNEGNLYNFCLENVKEFRKILESIVFKYEYFEFYIEDHIIDNFILIDNYINLQFNNFKIKNKIIKDLEEELTKSEKLLEVNSILSNFSKVIMDSTDIFNFNIELDEQIKFSNLLKLFNPRIYVEENSFLENLINYIDINLELFRYNLIVFINLSNFLDENELLELKNYIKMQQIYSINIEYKSLADKSGNYDIIIDEDLCRIK